MKTKNVFKLLALIFITLFIGACNDDDPEPLSFYDTNYEVRVHGTRYIGPQTGSGDYSLQVENPYLLSASEEKGWSAPEGMLLVRGLLTGESTLSVTDKRTGETINIKIKVYYSPRRVIKAVTCISKIKSCHCLFNFFLYRVHDIPV